MLSALGDDVFVELRHLPAEEPAALPPSSRARCRCRRHSRRCCCLQGVQHRRLQLHTPASSPPARPAPGRRLVRAEHPAPGQGLMPTPAPACLPSPARFSLPAPAPTPPRPGLRHLSLYQVGELTASAPCQPPRKAASVPTSVSFSAPPAPCRRRRAQHSVVSVSRACRGVRLVRRCEAATNGTAPSRDGRSPSGGVPEGTLQLTRSASAPRHPAPPAGKLGHQDAAGCQPSAGQRQPTAPAAPHQRQEQVAVRQPCQSACRLVVAGPRGLVGQAGVCQRCPPLPLPAHLRVGPTGAGAEVVPYSEPVGPKCSPSRSAIRKMRRQPSRRS